MVGVEKEIFLRSLNTSHVLINPLITSGTSMESAGLNTSHVLINLLHLSHLQISGLCLNTSHVLINQS